MEKQRALSGHLRVALWAAVIAASGALLAGLGGGALARALPAGGAADPLPVYTSLSLAAEDEPVLPIWQRYDPDQLVDSADGEPGLSLSGVYAFLFDLLGIYGVWEGDDTGPLPFGILAGDGGVAYYLKDYAVPGALQFTNLYSGRTMEQTGVTLDLAIGDDLSGMQLSARLYIPDQPAAHRTQLDQAVQMVQEDLTRFLAGWQDTLLGIPPESWYTLTDGVGAELAFRLQDRPYQDPYALPEGESRLQLLCDELMLDAQIIRLDNEVLLTLTDRYSGSMVCVYYDARLCCVSGVAIQLT